MTDERWRANESDDAIRASDADRDRTAESLRTHHEAGRLTGDELQERLERCMSAKTLGELRALVSDLPGERPREPRPAWARRRFWPPLLPLLGIALLLAALVHAVWFAAAWHGGGAWHHGWHHHHWFPWPLALLLIGAWLFAARRWRCASPPAPGAR